MRARDHPAPAGVGAEHGVARGLVGIGDDDGRRIDRFGDAATDAFVWTRCTDGTYRLGRIAGPLRSGSDSGSGSGSDSGEHDDAAGLTHVRTADWLERPFAEPEVPAGVAATFARGGRNFQRTHGAAVERRTAEIWAAQAP